MIRFQRVGRKNDPSFRLVLTNKENSTKSGRYLEVLGHHNFRHKDMAKVEGERVRYWLSQGAQASLTAHNFLITHKVIEGKKLDALPSRKSAMKNKKAPEVKGEVKTEGKTEAKAEETKTPEVAPVTA